MTTPSTSTETLFIAVVLAVASAFIYATLKTVQSRGHQDRGTVGVLAIVLVFWLVVPAILASQGVLDRYSPPPAPGFILIGLITLGTVILGWPRRLSGISGTP